MSIAEHVGVVRTVVMRDLAQVTALLEADPIENCFVASRVRAGGTDPWRLGGELLGYFDGDRLVSMLYLGANLAPVAATPATIAAFADRLRRAPRRCSSFVGRSEEVLELWRLLEPAWGDAREVRQRQPLMAIDHESPVAPDPRLRRARPEDLGILVPACIDMFTGEVGVSPVAMGGRSAYEARVAELVAAGRAYAVIEDGEVVFKAEVGAIGEGVCQVQGVWVAPRLRGRGLAAGCMAALVGQVRREHAPVVSLYVNDFNTAARKAYLAAGFAEVGTFATVLF